MCNFTLLVLAPLIKNSSTNFFIVEQYYFGGATHNVSTVTDKLYELGKQCKVNQKYTHVHKI